MLDFEAITCELVRALRGARSQAALSRRLRYAGNVVYLWESGRRSPTLASLLWLAHRTGIDVQVALDGFQKTRTQDAGDPWTPDGAAALLRDLQGGNSAAALGRQLDLSRHTVARWYRGETEPRLPVALGLIELCTRRALDFVALFADPSALPSAREPWAQLQSARAVVSEHPWSSAILLALELQRYRALGTHAPGWIARELDLPVEEEQGLLDALVAAGQVRLHEGRYERTGAPSLDARLPGGSLALRRWWAGVSLERTRAAPGCSGAWNLFTVSSADFQRIKQLQRDYFRGLRNVVAQTDSKDHLVLASMQLVVLGEDPP